LQSVGLEQQSALIILKNARRVAGIDVTERGDLFVVAADESRRKADTAGSRHDRLIYLQQQMRDGISVFDIWILIELRAALAKDILSGRRDMQSGLALAGDVHQDEQELGLGDMHDVKKIAAHARRFILRR
jgi:hypothetical protein